jgi:hypothetical protein
LCFELVKEVILIIAFVIPETVPEARTGIASHSVDCCAIFLALSFIHPGSVTALKQILCIILTCQASRFFRHLIVWFFCYMLFQSKSYCHVNIAVLRRHVLCDIFDCPGLISLHRNRLVTAGFFGLLDVRFRAVIGSRRIRVDRIECTLVTGISRNSGFGLNRTILFGDFFGRGRHVGVNVCGF